MNNINFHLKIGNDYNASNSTGQRELRQDIVNRTKIHNTAKFMVIK